LYYTAVSISGRVSIIEREDDVLRFLDLLVSANEKSTEPWELDRTDERYMKLLSGNVVFSVSMDQVEASFKMNQNKSEEDQRKVIDSLSATDCPSNQEVSEFMLKNVQCPILQK
jgi:transcriptional regulator